MEVGPPTRSSPAICKIAIACAALALAHCGEAPARPSPAAPAIAAPPGTTGAIGVPASSAAPAPSPTTAAATGPRVAASPDTPLCVEDCADGRCDSPPIWDRLAHPAPAEIELRQLGHDVETHRWVGIYDDRTVCFTMERALFPAGRELAFGPRAGSLAAGAAHARPEERAILTRVFLEHDRGGTPALVHGFTDPGEATSPAEARRLSEQRARAAVDWFVAGGIPRARLQPAPHGWALSARIEPAEEAIRNNRRAELGFQAAPPSCARLSFAAPLSAQGKASAVRTIRALSGVPRAPAAGTHSLRCCLTARDATGETSTCLREHEDAPDVRAGVALCRAVSAALPDCRALVSALRDGP